MMACHRSFCCYRRSLVLLCWFPLCAVALIVLLGGPIDSATRRYLSSWAAVNNIFNETSLIAPSPINGNNIDNKADRRLGSPVAHIDGNGAHGEESADADWRLGAQWGTENGNDANEEQGGDGPPSTEFRFQFPTIAALTDAALYTDQINPLSAMPDVAVDLESDARAVLMTAMVRRFLSQWASIDADPSGMFAQPMVTSHVRQALRNASRTSCAMLVRIVRGKLFVRYPVGSFDQPWWQLRLERTLSWIKSALSQYNHILKDITVECAINLADTPASFDSVMRARFVNSALPWFSPTTSGVHVDIPIPDAVEQASGYMPEQGVLGALTSWEDRIPKALYTGPSQPFPTSLSNMGANPGLRLKVYSLMQPSLLEVDFQTLDGIDAAVLQHLGALNISAGSGMDAAAKASYQYLVAASGTIHSPSICGAMAAAQVIILQDMGFMEFFYAAMQPWKHFAPVRKPFDNILETIQYLKAHPSVGATMSAESRAFGGLFCTDAGRVLYWAVLLREWSKLTRVETDLSEPAVCGDDVSPNGYLDVAFTACDPSPPEEMAKVRHAEREMCHHHCIPEIDDFLWVRLQYT